jgi:hypothetical protein
MSEFWKRNKSTQVEQGREKELMANKAVAEEIMYGSSVHRPTLT